MRVSYYKTPRSSPAALRDALEGEVYCVNQAWFAEDGSAVISFIGFPVELSVVGEQMGFLAMNFRKLEEIKLCVAAAEKAKQLSLQPV